MSLDLNPYSILGVSENATQEEIKIAYRRTARRLHPDVNPQHPGAAVQFQDVTAAYEILSDTQQRSMYDDRARYNDANSPFQFTLRVTPSKRTLSPLEEPQVVYLLADILPDPNARKQQKTRETHLNLTLVLDHSNSMSGTRMERVKVAAHQIIDQLSEKDIISVIGFNDRAEVIIPATPVTQKPSLKAKVSMMVASGSTEIFQGLSNGYEQTHKYLAPKLVNHIILLTDGNTFGDHQKCIDLAHKAAKDGIVISAMGLGDEWNDAFLDELAAATGGTSTYIRSASSVVKFLNDHVRNLSDAFAERVQISIAPDADIHIESAFKLSPQPQPLPITDGYIPLGSLQSNRVISVLLQFQMPGNMPVGFRSLARLVAVGDILDNQHQRYQAVSDVSLEITENPPLEDPPIAILDALGKLTLYRMQERASEALESGDVEEATRRLENLATRLLAIGEEDLANQTMAEARRVAHTQNLSDKGRKTMKYGTRHLLSPTIAED